MQDREAVGSGRERGECREDELASDRLALVEGQGGLYTEGVRCDRTVDMIPDTPQHCHYEAGSIIVVIYCDGPVRTDMRINRRSLDSDGHNL